MSFLLLATAVSAAFFMQTVGAIGCVPAIFVFGDSTVDVGNNNYLPGDQAKANFPPYGIDYPFHQPTGRFCNGYLAVDFIAQKLDFKESPPPYLSITSDAQLFQGVNFASGGAGILDSTGQNISIPLNTQIRYFEEVTRHLKTQMGDEAADLFLSKSLFIFNAGLNDLFAFYYVYGLQNKTQEDHFIGLLAHHYRNQLQTLYKLGARKFAVFGASQIGCTPSFRLTTPSGDCVEAPNEFARQFLEATKVLLHDLTSTSEGMSYVLVDVNEIVSVLLSEPFKYGLKELKSACCGSGRLNAETYCTPNSTYCSNRRDHFFWDSDHVTEAVYKVMADLAYHGGRKFAIPVNIEQLAKS